MTSNRPYLVRAIYDWILDNGLTPHLVVDASDEQVVVPGQFIEDGKIVLNISPSSVRDLDMGNTFIQFGARFSGSHFAVAVPARSVLAIYARENGKGLAFPPGEEDGSPDDPEPQPSPPKPPSLRVVK